MFVNKEHETVYKNKWVEVRKSQDDFYYLQRSGKNSVAILLYNDMGEILVRFQPLSAVEKDGPSTNRMSACPITGSIDEGEDYLEAAIREVKEETGYDVRDYIECCGNYIVSTQCNEICFMYTANASALAPEEIKGDGGYHESISYNRWMSRDEVDELQNVYGGLLILNNVVKNILDVGKVLKEGKNMDENLNTLKSDYIEISEPLNPEMSIQDMVRELMSSYHKTGKIGSSTPKNDDAAREQAVAIAFSMKEKN